MVTRVTRLLLAILSGVLAEGAMAADTPSVGALASRLLGASGFSGGLAVHVGCGDGVLTAELGADGKFLVHGLGLDPASMARARETIAARGLYGRVSVEHASIDHLPYADGLVNVVVIDAPSRCREAGLSFAEVFRVLCPNGAVLVRDPSPGAVAAAPREDLAKAGLRIAGGDDLPAEWVKALKPRPAGMDDWTHYDHGPDGNRVSGDQLIGPPARLQWIAGPTLARHHYS